MSTNPLFNTPGARSDREVYRDLGKLRDSDQKERSYEMLSDIHAKSNHSDSLSSSYISTKQSFKPELRNLKNERYLLRLTRSETNSPRVDYTPTSFSAAVKNKLQFGSNILPDLELAKPPTIQHSNSSKSIEDLENQWELLKKQHNFEPRGSCSPFRDYSHTDTSPMKLENRRK